MEPKRGHQWLTDSPNSELFSNKARAVECTDARIGMGVLQMNLSDWDSSLAFGQLTNHLFTSVNVHSANLVAGNMSAMDDQGFAGRGYLGEQYNNAPYFGLPLTVHDSISPYGLGGIRKVRVNQVSDFTHRIHEPMAHFYNEGVPRSLDMDSWYSRVQNNPVSFGKTGNSSGKSFSFAGPIFSKPGESLPPNFSKDGVAFVPMSCLYDNRDINFSPSGKSFERGVRSVLMGQPFQKTGSNFFSMSPSYNKGQENFMSLLTSYGKPVENNFMSGTSFPKEGANVSSIGPPPCETSGVVTFMPPNRDGADQDNISITQQGGSSTISFGGTQSDNVLVSSSSTVNGCEGFGNVAETFQDPVQKETEVNVLGKFSCGQIAGPNVETVPKSKESKTAKKASTNTFPSNVKSLLSTGMFDGVPVKYSSWSREKNLVGIVKGAGYLCGCQECQLTQVLNAYEFERHANCKTKHPNNHIYFMSGRSVYAVVQELKNTSQEKLFDALQDITGSQINLKNFEAWKESFQAASVELQRIYGEDGATLAS